MMMFIVEMLTVVIVVFIAFSIIFKKYQNLSNISFFISLLSTAAMILSDSMSIVQPDYVNQWKRVALVSEAIMAPSWLLFTLSFVRDSQWNTINKFFKLIIILSPLMVVYFLFVPMEYIFYSPEFANEGILILEKAGYISSILLLLYSIMSIMSLEAILRSSSGLNRWHIKYTLIGVGGILAINIFYYSHALLFRSIDINLLPVKTGVILVSSIFIGFSLLRHRVMDMEIVVSRKVLYKSLSLFIVGGYLLSLGLVGEGMRYFGPHTGKNIATFLGFIGAILVLTFILSEQLRRKVVVFIDKNFFKQKYDYRVQWLQFTHRISLKHSLDELLYSIVEGFKETLGVVGAAIWLKEKETGEYVCAKIIDTYKGNIKPGSGLIGFLNKSKWVLDVNDVNCRDIVIENEEFIERNMASLIVPLLDLDELIGFVILSEDLAGSEYNYEDYDLLKTLARQVAAEIINLKLSEELIEAKEMEAMGRLSSFITHDLKNAASMLSLIVQNAEEHIDNPEFQKDAIMAISNTSEKINAIIGKLKNLPKKTRLNLQCSDLGFCVKSAINELNLNGNEKLSFKELQSVKTFFDYEEIVKVIHNLIINALDAIDEQGKIEISVGRENMLAFVKVADNGCGISKEFIEKNLFRPFQTTKNKGLGIGLYQCKTIVEAHSGQLKVESREGEGTGFIMYLPVKS